jgi:ubiquinol-cytochrome c reductase cytochrome b subunit
MLGVMAVTDSLKELGTRGTQIYFLFFAVTYIHSRPRQANYLMWFAILIVTVLFWDFLRYDTSFTEIQRGLFWQMLLIPAAYLATTLLLPHFVGGANEEKEVPTRVTG